MTWPGTALLTASRAFLSRRTPPLNSTQWFLRDRYRDTTLWRRKKEQDSVSPFERHGRAIRKEAGVLYRRLQDGE